MPNGKITPFFAEAATQGRQITLLFLATEDTPLRSLSYAGQAGHTEIFLTTDGHGFTQINTVFGQLCVLGGGNALPKGCACHPPSSTRANCPSIKLTVFPSAKCQCWPKDSHQFLSRAKTRIPLARHRARRVKFWEAEDAGQITQN
jgi:hypothetical protein